MGRTVIVMGREADEALVVAALHAGAGDYLTWNRLGRLKSAVGRELRAAQGRKRLEDAERSRREAEERYRALIEEIPALTYIAWADRRQPRLREPADQGHDRLHARGVAGRARHVGRAASTPRTASACWPVPRGARPARRFACEYRIARPRGARGLVARRGARAADGDGKAALPARASSRHHRAQAGGGDAAAPACTTTRSPACRTARCCWSASSSALVGRRATTGGRWRC